MSSTTRLDQPRPSKEPSMDEILASIRKIIADDVSSATSSKRSTPAPAQHVAPKPSQMEAASSDEPRVPPANDDKGPIAPQESELGLSPLLSSSPQAEAAASFAALNHTVFSKSARTIEDVVQDMLRPMLQDWLDAHLPALVERLVRQEIERISGRL
jgi:uncharacterized protein